MHPQTRAGHSSWTALHQAQYFRTSLPLTPTGIPTSGSLLDSPRAAGASKPDFNSLNPFIVISIQQSAIALWSSFLASECAEAVVVVMVTTLPAQMTQSIPPQSSWHVELSVSSKAEPLLKKKKKPTHFITHRLLIRLAAVIACGDISDMQDVVNTTKLRVRVRGFEVPQSLKYSFDRRRIIAQEIGSLRYVIAIPTSRWLFSVTRFRSILHVWHLKPLSGEKRTGRTQFSQLKEQIFRGKWLSIEADFTALLRSASAIFKFQQRFQFQRAKTQPCHSAQSW